MSTIVQATDVTGMPSRRIRSPGARMRRCTVRPGWRRWSRAGTDNSSRSAHTGQRPKWAAALEWLIADSGLQASTAAIQTPRRSICGRPTA